MNSPNPQHPEVVFATTNIDKFSTAQTVCGELGIVLVQAEIEVDEIQGVEPARIAHDKARKAYEVVGRPVVVSDDFWAINGLNGFPGAYMHDMNTWLSVEDFLRLTAQMEDRSVIMTQSVVHFDGVTSTLFSGTIGGTLLREARGESRHPFVRLIALDGDDGKSLAQVLTTPKNAEKSAAQRAAGAVWHEFAHWIINNSPAV